MYFPFKLVLNFIMKYVFTKTCITQKKNFEDSNPVFIYLSKASI